MNDIKRQTNKFISANTEFTKVIIEGKKIKFFLRGSDFQWEPEHFSLNSQVRQKIDELAVLLGLPKS